MNKLFKSFDYDDEPEFKEKQSRPDKIWLEIDELGCNGVEDIQQNINVTSNEVFEMIIKEIKGF